MMDGMMMMCPGCGPWMMGGMILFSLATIVVLVLAAEALIKYLRS